MHAKEFMTKSPITCSLDATLEEAAETMLRKNIGGLLIVDSNDKLVGILTESDFVGKKIDIPHALVSLKQLLGKTFQNQSIDEIFSKAKDNKVSSVMTSHPVTINPESNLNDIVELMLDKKIKRLPVIENDKLVGIVTRRDLIKAFSLAK